VKSVAVQLSKALVGKSLSLEHPLQAESNISPLLKFSRGKVTRPEQPLQVDEKLVPELVSITDGKTPRGQSFQASEKFSTVEVITSVLQK
jgi:hypothetical protein